MPPHHDGQLLGREAVPPCLELGLLGGLPGGDDRLGFGLGVLGGLLLGADVTFGPAVIGQAALGGIWAGCASLGWVLSSAMASTCM